MTEISIERYNIWTSPVKPLYLFFPRIDETIEPCMLDCVGHSVLGVDIDAVRDKK